jgi:hypothetical protein
MNCFSCGNYAYYYGIDMQDRPVCYICIIEKDIATKTPKYYQDEAWKKGGFVDESRQV